MKRLIFAFVTLLIAAHIGLAQKNGFDPGSKETAVHNEIKFSVPNGFEITPGQTSAIMRGSRSNGQFVARPGSLDTGQITGIAQDLVRKIVPGENFQFKSVPGRPILRKSSLQVGDGELKCISDKNSLVAITYNVLNVDGKTVVVGFGFKVTTPPDQARQLFDSDRGAGMSVPDLAAQAHILTSITGEPFLSIFPGVFVTARPR